MNQQQGSPVRAVLRTRTLILTWCGYSRDVSDLSGLWYACKAIEVVLKNSVIARRMRD